jgi:periplasmic divalent cation tolerance protein
MTDFQVVLCNCPDIFLAEQLAQHLVEEKLAACVNIIPNVQSFYLWENKLVKDQEITLLIKTTSDCFNELEKAIKKLHTYQTPEIIALPIINGHQPYLNWLTENTRKPA